MPNYRRVQRRNVTPYDPLKNYANVLKADGNNFCLLDMDALQGTFIALKAGDLVEIVPREGRDLIIRRVSAQNLLDEGFEVEP